MSRIPWTARMTNERVLELARVQQEMVATIRVRTLRFLGHVLQGDELERDVLLRRV